MKWKVICDECGLEKMIGMDPSYKIKDVQKMLERLHKQKLLDHNCSGEYRIKHGTDVSKTDTKNSIRTRTSDIPDTGSEERVKDRIGKIAGEIKPHKGSK